MVHCGLIVGLCRKPFRISARLKFICELEYPMLFLGLKKEIFSGSVRKAFLKLFSLACLRDQFFWRHFLLCGNFFSTRLNIISKEITCVLGSVEGFPALACLIISLKI
jgi:hypothetical protein